MNNEFDRNEMWDVCRALRPDITEAEFDRLWIECLEGKRALERKRALN